MNKTNNSFKSKTEYTTGILTEVKQWTQIPYRISSISSEEKPNSAATLIETPHANQGWLSDKNCSFPQDVQLYFPHEVIIRQIQIRLHQYIIPSKIDIYIDQPNTIVMKKIGCLYPDNNEKSNYQAREQKSVFTEHQCTKVKLALMKNYSNKLNTYSQVGMIALTILGTYPENKDKLFKISDEEEKNVNEEKYESVIEGEKKLKELIHKKKNAIDREDYEKAQENKIQIDIVKKTIVSLKQLEKDKLKAIDNEDYDEAKKMKLKIDEEKSSLLEIGVSNKGVNCSSSKQINNYNQNNGEQKEIVIQKEEVKSSVVIVSNESNKKGKEKNAQIKGGGKKQRKDNSVNSLVKSNHINQNGFNKEKIAKPKHIDIDSIKVGIIKKNDNESAISSTNNLLSDNNANKDRERDKPHSIYDDLICKAFSSSVTKMIFDTDWKIKEEFLITIQEEINIFPNSTIFNSLEEEDVIQGIIAVCNYTLERNNIQVLLGGLDLVICFNCSSLAKAYYTQDNLPIDCLKILINKLGDIHQRVQEKVESAILSFSNCSCVGSNTIIKQIVNGQIPKRLLTSSKHSAARYNLLARLIEQFGLPKQSDDLFEDIIKMMKKGINSTKKDIRDSAFALITPIYTIIGDPLRKKLEGIRHQSLNQYDEVIRRLQGDNTESKKQDEEEISDNKQNETEEDLCLFCREFNGNSTQMKRHHSTQCPMIIICKKCSKMVEISNLSNHLLTKCEYKDQYKQCQRCKDPIESSEFNQHNILKNCNLLNEEKTVIRCPLCHHDINGWSSHLLTNGCPYNPRKNTRKK